MKKRLFVLCCMLCVGNLLFAQGILFEKGNFEDALAKAKVENKLLFVDVYTSWCGPCQRMSRDVFSRDNVGRYYNEHFVSYKLDAEKGNGPEICARYGVDAYPTFLFLDGEGKLIYKMVGYHDVKDFLMETDHVFIYAKYGGWELVEAKIQSGSGETAFWKDYYEIADRDRKQEILRKYLSSMSDAELFKTGNGFLVGKADYDRELYLRIARGIVNSDVKEVNFSIYFEYPFEDKVAAYLYQSIKEGNEVWFHELLDLKNILESNSRITPSDINAVENLSVSREFLLLSFYQKNMNNEKAFKEIVVGYVDHLIEKNPLDSIRKLREGKADKQMTAKDSLLLELLTEMFKDRLTEEGRNQSALWQYRTIANAIVDWTNYYWQVTPSDKVIRERCVKWLNYACAINPCNPEAPVKAASLLVRLNHEKDALFHLEQAISQQEKVKNTDMQQIRRLELMLNSVKKGKL